MQRSLVVLGLGLFVLSSIGMLGVSCAASGNGGIESGIGAAPSGGAGGLGASTSSGGQGNVGGLNLGGQGGGCQPGCSIDGGSVVDCNGNVVQTCAALDACVGGQCKPACDAAEQLKSSVGCRYHAVMMDGFAGASGGCFTAYVANTFAQPAHLTVSFNGAPIDLGLYAKVPQGSGQALTYGAFDPAAGLAPGQVVIIFLSQNGGVQCPVAAAVAGGAQVGGTGYGQSFRIESDVPVVAYQMLPYGGGFAAVTGASLLLPTSAWDTNYIAVNAYAYCPLAGTSPSLDIVAQDDGTAITILPKTAIVGGGGVPGGPANTPITYTLQSGQVLQLTQQEELSGSPIQATGPIGLWAGHPCMMVPPDQYACDHAEQQIPPVKALGSEYVGVSYRQRSAVAENPPWRIIGAVNGTQLTFDPPIAGAPASVDLGTVAEFDTYTPFVVHSQDKDHPFLLVTYMTGEATVTQFYGDADFVRIVPAAQYMRRYVFFTDPTYPETNLVVVRKRQDNAAFADVTLDCAGVLSGWAPVGSSPDYEFTRIDLISHNFQPQNGCDNGRHEMSSDGFFGVWVWGWGTPEASGTISVSYGYPAGENVQPVNDVVVPPIPR